MKIGEKNYNNNDNNSVNEKIVAMMVGRGKVYPCDPFVTNGSPIDCDVDPHPPPDGSNCSPKQIIMSHISPWLPTLKLDPTIDQLIVNNRTVAVYYICHHNDSS